MTETIQAWPGGPLKEQGGKQRYVCHKCLKPAPEGVTKVKNRWLCLNCHPERPGKRKRLIPCSRDSKPLSKPSTRQEIDSRAREDRQKAQTSLFAKQT